MFQSIALHDTLTVRVERGPFRLTCDDPACPADETNLVWRAAAAIVDRVAASRRAAGCRRSSRQADSGAGGPWRRQQRCRRRAPRAGDDVARRRRTGGGGRPSLGADVPYFLEGGTVLGLDRGDLLFPLADLPGAWVVLVVPGFGVSTKDAFGWWDRKEGADPCFEGAHPFQTTCRARSPNITPKLPELRGSCSAWARVTRRCRAAVRRFSACSSADPTPSARLWRSAEGRRTVLTRTTTRAAYQRLAGIAAHRINLPFAPRGSGHS